MHRDTHGRRCRHCAEPIHWPTVRLVGSRTFCSEACAIIWLSDEASRTAWRRTTLEMDRRARGLGHRVRLHLARWSASLAQRRLDRRLTAGPRAESLPWLWVPPREPAVALALLLIAWGAAGGYAPELRTPPPPVSTRPASIGPDLAARLSTNGRPVSQVVLLSVLAPAEAPALTTAPPAKPAPPARRPPIRITAEDITRGNTGVREIAFTFDGGNEANVAGEILDILRARNARGTMFLTGQFIRMFPDVVRRLVADGHEVGNHSDTHPRLTTYAQNRRQQTRPGVTREFVIGQLRRAEESFRSLTGQPMAPYWRAPYGEHNGEIRAWAAEAGYRHIAWTRGADMAEDLDTRDWVVDRSSRIYRTREEIAARILEFGQSRPEGLNGGIVLMHLATHRKADRPHEGLPDLLKTLQNQGYRLVTISELLGRIERDRRGSAETN
jgi:peptidoglycan/xylan/chitin deacetylase (PgdA/CDA1 family)